MSPIRKVTIVGASGKLGPSILSALLATPQFTLTVLQRASSTSTYPPDVSVTTVPDSFPVSELTSALSGQDALIVVFAGTNDDLQIKLADAAAAAGVRRFIPADFGSCDSSSARALELMPLYRAKQRVRQHLQELAKTTSLSWTSLVCGHFFDYGLRSGLLQFYPEKRMCRVFDGGEVRWSASTLDLIARATVKVLVMAEETRDRMLYIESFCVSQNEVLAACEKATGEKWRVEEKESEEFIREEKAKVDADPEDHVALEELVSVVGIVDANWEGKKDFANELLGLEMEDLDQVVKKVLGNGH